MRVMLYCFLFVSYERGMKRIAKLFQFSGYRLDMKARKIFFDYRIEFSKEDFLEFTETILLPKAPRGCSPELLQNILESLHLILGISYYKLYCPSQVKLPFPLSKEQAEFWNIVYAKGLGEFLYRNNLDPKRLPNFPSVKAKKDVVRMNPRERMLLGIGGGKDSIVAAELLKNFVVTSFLVETQKKDTVSETIIRKIGNPSLKIKRVLDPKIFEAYPDAYNGHVPISAVFAFLGFLSAILYDYKYVVVGNEQSSNFGNVTYRGEIINHQWSKSAEFETMFQNYTKKFITPDIVYFSLLRQFYEIRIANMFAQYKTYFPTFSSCNRNFKVFKKREDTLWCGECPKCVFAFLILSPFIPKKELIQIFHKNLFADEKLVSLFGDVLGFGVYKPFDCVGTSEESQAALSSAAKKYKNEIVIKTFLSRIKNVDRLTEQVFKTSPASTLPAPFRFLGIKSVCILGYGKEGKATEKYIRKNYPDLKIGICDENLDKNYLDKQKEYDLAIKTPGIQKGVVTIPYTTATNIFFSQNKNLTIGVTGSKGKSTTSSLIYEILKAAGKKVRLIGNIGSPMLEVLCEEVHPDEIFVIELSSYMLEDIEYSPNIAVLLNLFPEHMNYHGGVENYYTAKRRIFEFLKQGDLKIEEPFTEKIPLEKSEIPLLGAHNLKNIRVAVKVARVLKISDDVIREAVKNFKPLPHRLGFVGTFRNIDFYDDAISTTPESTIAAIKSLKKVDTIFLGGEDRGYDFCELERTLRLYKIKNIVLFPDTGARILKSRKGFNVFETRSMKDAVKFAFENTEQGKICLLSMASPSYSLWKNFEEKGDEFTRLVRNY